MILTSPDRNFYPNEVILFGNSEGGEMLTNPLTNAGLGLDYFRYLFWFGLLVAACLPFLGAWHQKALASAREAGQAQAMKDQLEVLLDLPIPKDGAKAADSFEELIRKKEGRGRSDSTE